jgi:hypothetical protein
MRTAAITHSEVSRALMQSLTDKSRNIEYSEVIIICDIQIFVDFMDGIEQRN